MLGKTLVAEQCHSKHHNCDINLHKCGKNDIYVTNVARETHYPHNIVTMNTTTP